MDETKRETVIQIQLAIEGMYKDGKIAISDAGKQLVQVACDYLEAGEYTRAWDALAVAYDIHYWQGGYWREQRKQDREFRRQFDLVDDVFNLQHFRADGGGTA